MINHYKSILIVVLGLFALFSMGCGSSNTAPGDENLTIAEESENLSPANTTGVPVNAFDEDTDTAILSEGNPLKTIAPAKNIILMISDGQGFGTVMAADYYNGSPAAYESFPVKYFVTTYSSLGSYDPEKAWQRFDSPKSNPTDSAAAATAMATGVKAVPLTVGRQSVFEPLKNIVEVSSEYGKATGLVTSVPISHATPAAMTVHNIFRENYESLANEMIFHSELDVIMGGGHPHYDDNGELRSEPEYKYVGGEETYLDLADINGAIARDGKNWVYIELLEDFEKLSNGLINTDKLFGLPRIAKTLQQKRSGEKQIAYNAFFIPTVPTLEMMTLGALNILEKDEDGFFVMIEGGAIDWANHDNTAGRMIEEQNDFNNTVASVVDWIEDDTNGSNWDNTLLIVTADHETGYIWGSAEKEFTLVGDNGAGHMPEMHYHSKNYAGILDPLNADGIGMDLFELLFEGHHSNLLVPLYAKGVGSNLFDLLIDGTDLFYSELISVFDSEFDGTYVDNTDIFTVMNAVVAPESNKPLNGIWLKGDLHAHSLHSDGDSPVAAVLEAVESKGLEFFALTEHDSNMFEAGNYEEVIPSHWGDPDYASDHLVLLYGVEWTTNMGHANVWASAPFDYTELWRANSRSWEDKELEPDVYGAVTAAHEQGALFSVNHPSAWFCCPWEPLVENDMDSIEIWNALYRLPNLNGFASHPFWDKELRKGRRMTGVGGSDTHNLNGIQAWAYGHGNPTTWVYAEDRSGEAVLSAIKAGRVSISWAPDAPRLEIEADSDGNGEYETMMGENIIQTVDQEISFNVRIQPSIIPLSKNSVRQVMALEEGMLSRLAAGEKKSDEVLDASDFKDPGIVVVLKNGIPFKAWIVSGDTDMVSFSDIPKTTCHTYYRAKLFGKTTPNMITHLLYGNVKAITNPIYINFPKN